MAQELVTNLSNANIRPVIPRRLVVPLVLDRPQTGVVWNRTLDGLKPTQLPAFWSNGGSNLRHPGKKKPQMFESKIPFISGHLKRLSLVGVFALHVTSKLEAEGEAGALLQGFLGTERPFKFSLINGHTYFDAFEIEYVKKVHGDGSSIQTVGTVELDTKRARVDLVTIDVPDGTVIDKLKFSDIGTPASFIIFDVFLEFQASVGCPFHAEGGGVPLSELGSIVRLGDRVRFGQAMRQLEQSIDKTLDLDEAKGQALTFLSVITAATLEVGGTRDMVKVGLNAARELDRLTTTAEIKHKTKELTEKVALPFLQNGQGSSDRLLDRAFGILERSFAKQLSDDIIAKELGLSTSHFRFLFKQATGQPFHKYLIALRLERAYQLLLEGDLKVTQVATSVGFPGLSHFSRAFSSRFRMSPALVRRHRFPLDRKLVHD